MSVVMKPRDSFLLAFTKLRVRRIRLAVTLVVMSLLFAALVFLSIITNGAVKSVDSFSKEGLGGRFLVSATPVAYVPYDDSSLVAELQPEQDNLIAQKTALAKKLDVSYDAKSDSTLPLMNQQYSPSPDDVKLMPNPSSDITMAALQKQNQTLPISFADFIKLAKSYGAIHGYESTTPDYMGGLQTIQVLQDGKESYGDKSNNPYQGGMPTGLQTITTLGWNQMSDEMLKPFLLPGQTTAVGKDGSIPITAPYSAAEQLLGLDTLQATATSKQKLDRLITVRHDVAGKVATICYRNAASRNLLQTAVSQQDEMTANKGKKDYTPPALQYSLPAEACGPVTVKKDTRTAGEKKADANQEQFDAAFNSDATPVQGTFLVRIVGLTADMAMPTGGLSAGSILSNLLNSNLGEGWFSPISAFLPDSLATTAQGGLIANHSFTTQTYYAEFGTLAAAKKFIKQQGCDLGKSNYQGPSQMVKTCSAKHTMFMVGPYGNNAGAIADFQHTIWKYGKYVLLGVVVIAVFVMMGTLGKVIADSRRETAVFRALGAKRLHISQIYLTYALLIGLFIIVLSGVVGAIGAQIVNARLEPSMSVGAVLAYNAADVHKQFSLFGINVMYLGAIVIIILITALVGTLLSLLTNIRRNPIRDMRDE